MTEKELISAIINDSSEELECYITINGQDIPCSRELYLSYKRPGRRENKRQQRAKRPFINGKRCQGDCEQCPCYDGNKCSKTGDISLDELPDDGASAPISSQDVQSEAFISFTIGQMYETLASEDARCTEIFTLMLQELPQREIAETLDIADGTVTYYIKKIRQKLDKFR